MKKTLIFLLILLPLVVVSQQDSSKHDTLILDKLFNLIGKSVTKCFNKPIKLQSKFNFKNDSLNKNTLSFGVDGHYTFFHSASRYITPPSPSIPMVNVDGMSTLIGFRRMDTYSFDLNFDYSKYYRKYIFVTGLSYSNRTHLYQSDSNSIKSSTIFYGENYPYQNIIRFHVMANNIEFPLGFGIRIKKFQIIGYTRFSINLFYNCTMTDKYNVKSFESTKLFERHSGSKYYVKENPIMYIPGISITRDIGRHLILSIGANSMQFIYYNFQLGVNYKLKG